jgi:hypothetical protein
MSIYIKLMEPKNRERARERFELFFFCNEPNFIQTTKEIQYKSNKLAKALTKEFTATRSEKEWHECSPR